MVDNSLVAIMSLVLDHGRQCKPCSTNFSMTLQAELLSTDTSDFLKQIIFRKSFNSIFEAKIDNFSHNKLSRRGGGAY